MSKAMVGLGNCDNTSDANKPISSAAQSALDLKATIASPTFTGTVSGITKSMVGLGNVDNTTDAGKPISDAAQSALDLKAPIASPTFTGTVSGVSKSMVGLGNVDNTSDANKPVSSATQSALDAKANSSVTVNGHALTSNVTVTKSDLSLGNVDNTADADKPISTATQAALDLKASTSAMNAAIAAAAAGVGARSRVRVATTANVNLSTGLANGQTVDGVTLETGDLVLVRAQDDEEDNGVYTVPGSGAASRTAEFDTFNEHVGSMIGVSEGTASADSIWFCTSNAGGDLGTDPLVFTKLVIAGELIAANNLSDVASASTSRSNLGLGNVDNTSDANKPVSSATQTALNLKSNLASPTFTGTPAAPTAAADTNTTQVATTAFVIGQAYAKLASPTFTGAPALPTGTTGVTQSPGNNSTALATTAFVAAAVSAGGVPLGSFVTRETPGGLVDGSNAVFTLDNEAATGSEQVFVNGILQEGGGEDYTMTAADEITFETGSKPQTDDRLRVNYIIA